MKYTFFIKNNAQGISNIVNNLISQLSIYNYEYDSKYPDIVICIGGDGTVLRAIDKYKYYLSETTFLCLHKGDIGFYTEFKDLNNINIVDEISKSNRIEKSLLDICINNHYYYIVLNDLVILNTQSLLRTDIYSNKFKIEEFNGTGVCISTVLGSSGYNKSLMGPLISHKVEAFCLTPIAPINNVKYRTFNNSLIFSNKEDLFLLFEKNNKNTCIKKDGINVYIPNQEKLKTISVNYSNLKVRFFSREENSWNKIKDILDI